MSRRSTASELRRKAKGALKGRWLTAVVAFLLVTVFGMMGGSVSFDFSSLVYDTDTEIVEETEIIDETEFVEDVELDETMEAEEDAEWLREVKNCSRDENVDNVFYSKFHSCRCDVLAIISC